jgi:hypothetical protein
MYVAVRNGHTETVKWLLGMSVCMNVCACVCLSIPSFHSYMCHLFIQVQMLREKGEPMPQEDVDNLLCEITIDGDNRIGIAEFVQHMIQTSS